MTTTINGRTPEEIKWGLELCTSKCISNLACPYNEHGDGCATYLNKDALDLIQQLERERDAAVEDINEAAMTGCLCYVCSRNEKGHCKAFDHGIFEATVMCGQYEWRGVQEVE